MDNGLSSIFFQVCLQVRCMEWKPFKANAWEICVDILVTLFIFFYRKEKENPNFRSYCEGTKKSVMRGAKISGLLRLKLWNFCGNSKIMSNLLGRCHLKVELQNNGNKKVLNFLHHLMRGVLRFSIKDFLKLRISLFQYQIKLWTLWLNWALIRIILFYNALSVTILWFYLT